MTSVESSGQRETLDDHLEDASAMLVQRGVGVLRQLEQVSHQLRLLPQGAFLIKHLRAQHGDLVSQLAVELVEVGVGARTRRSQALPSDELRELELEFVHVRT